MACALVFVMVFGFESVMEFVKSCALVFAKQFVRVSVIQFEMEFEILCVSESEIRFVRVSDL